MFDWHLNAYLERTLTVQHARVLRAGPRKQAGIGGRRPRVELNHTHAIETEVRVVVERGHARSEAAADGEIDNVCVKGRANARRNAFGKVTTQRGGDAIARVKETLREEHVIVLRQRGEHTALDKAAEFLGDCNRMEKNIEML